MLRLSSPVTDLPRIGPAKAKYLEKLGIAHVRDFLYTFPRKYDDFSVITPINQLKPGQTMTVRGRVKSVQEKWGFRGRQRLLRIFVDIADDTGTLNVTWFNLRFLAKQLWKGRELYVAGKVEASSVKTRDAKTAGVNAPLAPPAGGEGLGGVFRMRSPVIEFIDGNKDPTHAGRITPVYPETYGVSSRFLRYQVKQALPLMTTIPEYLPADIRRRQKLIGIHEAVSTVHFPDSTQKLARAQRRLHFDELFFLQLAALVRRQARRQAQAQPISAAASTLKKFLQGLPYTLTSAQHQALKEITIDLAKDTPMNRLLQGDVGSGKSVIAALAAHLALSANQKVLYLAPTEILARQQYSSFKQLLGSERVALLIGSLRPNQRREVQAKLQDQKPVCVIGTHALLQETISVKNLGLVVVDEQHRFGVAQRKNLQDRAASAYTPHLLSMTATPIPRTLSLTVYGDLDVSVLNELPPGRQPIATSIVAPGERDEAVLHILEELHRGRQAYVIAPLVEASEKLEVKSAKATAIEMQRLFPDIAVGLLHGQLSSEEKAGALNNFAAGALQLLVATSIVEVGVDVPNATIMIIEGAERFGLSALHQFRGRIGRGAHASYCYLFPTTDAGVNNPRLQALAATNDGFKIAEQDLRLRGPGEMYGVAQSGFGNLKVASLLDYDMIKRARTEAEALLAKDPQLTEHDILRRKVEQKNLVAHFE